MHTYATLKLREIPKEERPRERMIAYGAGALSNAELIAILLRTGTKNESAVSLAQRLLKQCGGLRQLVEMEMEQLTDIKGIGTAKALQILAAFELGKRLARTGPGTPISIRSPQDVAELFMEELRYLPKEHFVCLYLNSKNHVISRETLSVGTLNASLVHPREVFRPAIQKNSASIICAHNHPSGDPTPSPEDIQMTQRLYEAGKLIGIELLDHIIIGDNRYISLKEHGYL
jgi:DNA repair protein RadC